MTDRDLLSSALATLLPTHWRSPVEGIYVCRWCTAYYTTRSVKVSLFKRRWKMRMNMVQLGLWDAAPVSEPEIRVVPAYYWELWACSEECLRAAQSHYALTVMNVPGLMA